MRAITKGFVLGAAATTHGEMFFGCTFKARGIKEVRTAGHNIGTVWRDKDGRLTIPVAVFDIIDRVTQSS